MTGYSIIQTTPATTGNFRTVIETLWKDNLSFPFENRFDWLYKNNPAGPAITWLAVDENTKSIVGCNTLFPRNLLVNNSRLQMGIASDFAVNKEHRVFGPALTLQKTITANSNKAGFAFTFAFPNKASQGIFLRAGYRVLGEAGMWSKLLRTEQKLEPYVKNAALAKLIGSCLNAALWLADQRHFNVGRRLYFHEVLSKCDERFDALWEEIKAGYCIAGERTASFLNWRYTASGAEKFQYFCLFDKGTKKLRGYIIYAVKNNVANIFDLFAVKQGKVIECLLIEFTRRMRKEQVISILLSYFGNSEFAARIAKLDFIRRPTKRQCQVFIEEGALSDKKSDILEKDNWYVFDGEMDL